MGAFIDENAPIIVSWSTVEAYFAAEYGYELEDLLRLKWRRFKVLLHRGLVIHHGSSSEKFDWEAALDKAIGRETPSKVHRMNLDEFMSKVAG